MTAEIVTIASDQLILGISTLGAEMQSLADSEGRALLWDGDPAFWTGRAPILFPVIGVLKDGQYRLDGTRYAMPKHGFARHSIFDIVDQADDAVTLRLAASDETRAIYPFEFRLDLRFSIIGATLSVEATIANLGDTVMPASFGFHPALRWPLPYGQTRDAHAIRFDHAEPAPVRRIDANGLLLPQAVPTPVVGDTLTLRDDLFVADALIFDALKSRRVSYGGPGGARLEVSFADFPTLGVWTKPGAGFICIEPWQGFSDPVGFDGDIRDKPGIIEIAAGTSKHLAMHIALIDQDTPEIPMFDNAIAIVTGGESGIGAACAKALGDAGARVVITYYKDEAAAQHVCASIGGSDRAIAVQTDVGDEAAVTALFDMAEQAFGTASLLVNSAGLNMSGVLLADMELAQFDRVVRSDLYGPFLTCRALVRRLEAKAMTGRIVNISSIHERAPRPGGVDYDSAKGGLSQLTATLALELAPKGIAVNGVAPGMILTPMNQSALDNAAELKAKEAAIPWGRAGRPEEVAALVNFLLSPAADYISGTTVTIDGALSLTVAQGA